MIYNNIIYIDKTKFIQEWRERRDSEEYKNLQGTYPVVLMSFVDIKETSFEAVEKNGYIIEE